MPAYVFLVTDVQNVFSRHSGSYLPAQRQVATPLESRLREGGVVHCLVGGVGGLGVGGWKAGRRRRRTCRHRPACARPGGTWRAGTKRRVGVYTRGRHSLNLAVDTLGLTRSQISDQDGRRQGRKGFRESEAEGGLEERQGWTPVPCRQVGIIFLEEGGSFGRERDATASGGVESSL